MLCYVMLCYVMLCYVMLSYNKLCPPLPEGRGNPYNGLYGERSTQKGYILQASVYKRVGKSVI